MRCSIQYTAEHKFHTVLQIRTLAFPLPAKITSIICGQHIHKSSKLYLQSSMLYSNPDYSTAYNMLYVYSSVLSSYCITPLEVQRSSRGAVADTYPTAERRETSSTARGPLRPTLCSTGRTRRSSGRTPRRSNAATALLPTRSRPPRGHQPRAACRVSAVGRPPSVSTPTSARDEKAARCSQGKQRNNGMS